MQFATLVILTATFSVVAFMLSLALNFQRVLTVWGEQVQVSAYLEEGLSPARLEDLKREVSKRPEVATVDYISKEKAADLFRDQMASYAPDLMSDSEFATPFPASLQIKLRSDKAGDGQLAELESFAKTLSSADGVEDVSYGQSWVSNYASFVAVMKSVGIVVGSILLIGCIFIVANSVRTLVSGRREEIEIFELIGATSSNVRRPYILEGIFLCFASAIAAIAFNFLLYGWQVSLMKKSLAFARMAQEFHFLSFAQLGFFICAAVLLGGIGSWVTVRSLNDGWSAARGIQS